MLAVEEAEIAQFEAICDRERCPFAVVGESTEDKRIELNDHHFDNKPIDLPMDVLFGKPPKMHRNVQSAVMHPVNEGLEGIELSEAIHRVLALPAVASKGFLITIGDRTITGQVCRDQMVGPCAGPRGRLCGHGNVLHDYVGEAMAMGERVTTALFDAPASGRMAIAETVTNLLGADVPTLEHIKLSANWMVAAGHGAEDAKLYATVKAVAEDLCPELGICIPVGKDSMSMRTVWEEQGEARSNTAPLSLIVSGFAPVADIRQSLTPELARKEDSLLVLISLSSDRFRLGGSSLAQVFGRSLGSVPDLDSAQALKAFFELIKQSKAEALLTAYHDRSDGGLFACVAEMCFAGHCGVDLELGQFSGAAEPVEILFNEELGAVVQLAEYDLPRLSELAEQYGLGGCVTPIGRVNDRDELAIRLSDQLLFSAARQSCSDAGQRRASHAGAADNSECAKEEFDGLLDVADPGLHAELTFDPTMIFARHLSISMSNPRSLFGEQGVNGQIEMAAAFVRAGFEAIDVHMTDLIESRVSLSSLT